MKNYISGLSLNSKLAVLAVVLGLIAIILGNPYQGKKVTINERELSLIVQKEEDHVSAKDVADWIIKGRADFKLIDIRSEKEFSEYHIPSAVNIPIGELDKSPLMRNDKIIIYSDQGIHSAQAWFLLRVRDFKNVFMLKGGLDEWRSAILFPKIPEDATAEQMKEFDKIKEVSKFFGGTPQSQGKEEVSPSKMAMPKLQTPIPATIPSGGVKKKKEGC